jgi:prepilin-type N-terminal cleavage/methylation domain-containing protein/prepilin-type processing-associated H-X9-DG protein
VSKRGFTLVELLVVIAIIAVLVSILLPALGKARATARSVQCLSNMRTLGQVMVSFANDHGGRYPGGGSTTGGSLSWHYMLNETYFKGQNAVPRLILELSGGRSNEVKITCPEAIFVSASTFWRIYAINNMAVGGPNWAPNPPQGIYGKAVDNPSTLNVRISWVWAYYGSKMTIFTQSAKKVLVFESDRNDGQMVSADFDMYQNDSTLYPPYDAAGGVYSFRHKNRMNVLFVDGHCESVPYSKRGPLSLVGNWQVN